MEALKIDTNVIRFMNRTRHGWQKTLIIKPRFNRAIKNFCPHAFSLQLIWGLYFPRSQVNRLGTTVVSLYSRSAPSFHPYAKSTTPTNKKRYKIFIRTKKKSYLIFCTRMNKLQENACTLKPYRRRHHLISRQNFTVTEF